MFICKRSGSFSVGLVLWWAFSTSSRQILICVVVTINGKWPAACCAMNDDRCNMEPKTESTLCSIEPTLPSKTEPTEYELLATPLPGDSTPCQSDDDATKGQLSTVSDFTKTNSSVKDTAVACPSSSHCCAPHSTAASANESNYLFMLIDVLSLSQHNLNYLLPETLVLR